MSARCQRSAGGAGNAGGQLHEHSPATFRRELGHDGHARASGVRRRVKPLFQRSVGVGHGCPRHASTLIFSSRASGVWEAAAIARMASSLLVLGAEVGFRHVFGDRVPDLEDVEFGVGLEVCLLVVAEAGEGAEQAVAGGQVVSQCAADAGFEVGICWQLPLDVGERCLEEAMAGGGSYLAAVPAQQEIEVFAVQSAVRGWSAQRQAASSRRRASL